MSFKKKTAAVVLMSAVAAIAASQVSAQGRDYITAVGSSTVYPFSTVVAERFGRASDFKTPKIESTGTGGGFKLFCSGLGLDTPSIANASRAIKSSEVEQCVQNGVDQIIEVKIGYDGIVVANSANAKALDLTRDQLYLALAKQVPNPDGSQTLVPNPYKNWSDIDKSLPNISIEVIGPPPSSGTRDSFVELVVEHSCKSRDWLKAVEKTDKNLYKSQCFSLREDGAYVEAGENDNLIIQKLVANPKALGIFGFSFLSENEDKIQAVKVEGVQPSFDSIADSSYTIARPLYFYVKKGHIGAIPGIAEFLAAYTSDQSMGEDGYLTEKGLISLPEAELKAIQARVKNQEVLAP